MTWIGPDVADSRVLLVTPQGQWSARRLREAAQTWWDTSGPTDVVPCPDAQSTVVALLALEGRTREAVLLPPDSADSVAGAPQSDTESAGDQPIETRWVLLTSGTTGTPKRISHTRHSLSRTVRSSARTSGFVWGLLYQPSRMAGLQVIAQALGSGATLVAPSLDWPLAQQLEFLAEHGVDALSATPTLWRQILQLPASDRLDLEQITLGGEIADQRILDALASRFPEARITHVFAATESGAAFAVTDGRAGFPVTYLDESSYGIRLAVIDSMLHVHAPDVLGADADGFVCTGDLVEVTDDRVFFLGRESGAVNIGGAKVMPEKVEDLLRGHPQVREARVSSRPNPFSGAILIAEVVVADTSTPDLAKDIRSWVRAQAPSHYVPAKVVVVEELTTTATGKTART